MSKFSPITLPPNSKNLTDQKDFCNIAIEDYYQDARQILKDAGSDFEKQTSAINQIADRLILYDNNLKVLRYVDQLCKEFEIKKGDFTIAIKDAVTRNEGKNKDEETTSAVSRVEQFILKKYEIFFNVVANKFEYREHGKTDFSELNIDNIYRELQKAHLTYSLPNLKSLMRSDFIPKKNVIEEYFKNLPAHDGEDHISKLASFIKINELNKNINEQKRFKVQFKKMLIRSIACSLEMDFNKQCFTLVGPKQNLGKSTFLRWLCPPKLSDYLAENIGTSKDDLIALTENFIVNIDELSTLSKYDINALKSVMSKDRVKVRLPYDERAGLYQRRCNFVASTNRMEFLNDETGSVRWICFWIEDIDWNYKKEIDINKVWAQAYNELQTTTFKYQLTPEEIEENEQANKTFLIRSPEMELIQKFMIPKTKADFNQDKSIVFKTATEIQHDLSLKSLTIKLNPINIGKSLKMLGFTQDSFYKSDDGISIKGYFLKITDGEIEPDRNQNILDEISEENLPF